jgi:hypothetical protein
VFPPDISMRRLHARKYLCAPRLFRDILCFIAVVIIVSGNIIVFLNPYLPDMTCPIDALQPCIFSISASSFAPRCSPALDTLRRSSLWIQAGHPIVSNISSCTESFVSGFLDAFGIWPSSLRLKHTSAEGLKPNPSVVVASFRSKSYRRPICRDTMDRAFSGHLNFVVLLKIDLNSRHDGANFESDAFDSCSINASRLSSRQASDLLHMWMAHRNNGFLVPFLECSVDRDLAARICAQENVLRMVLLVLPIDHLQRGAALGSSSPVYMQPSLPQPLRMVSLHSHNRSKSLHQIFGGDTVNAQRYSSFDRLATSIHMNLCASAVAAVNRAIFDAVHRKSPVLCLASAACFCPRPFIYSAGSCVSAGSRFAGLFKYGDKDYISHSRFVHQQSDPKDMARDRFARVYVAQMSPLRFLREPRHVLDIGCGGGCWSLLLAGPFVHVTVLIFDQTLARAAINMSNVMGIQDFVHIILTQATSSTFSASELLLPLMSTSPMKRSDFFGFEFLVLLDVMQSLSFSAVQDLTSALQPFMHTRSKALVSVLGIAESSNRQGEWYEPDKLEAAMSALQASVLWCGVVSHAPEVKEFGCDGCSLIELLLVGARKAPRAPPRLWHTSDFAIIGNQRSGRTCGMNNNVQELILRQELMRMKSLEDHEIFDSFQAWARVKPGPVSAIYRADFDGRLLVLPNFLRAVESHDPNQVVLCVHMDASRIKLLDIIARSWNGPVSVAIVVYHESFHSVIDLILHSRKSSQAIQRLCSIHLVRFAHSPEHYAVNSFRNIAAVFASSFWVLSIDADFVPIKGTRAVLQRAVELHGHGPDGAQLKRAFIVSVLASRDTFTEPLDFSTIESNLGDDLEHKFHSFPLPNGVKEKSGRSHQSHGGSDLEKWRDSTRNNKDMYQIAFSHSMEPYYVMPLHSWATVMYDERFRRWGGDKQSHAHELASASYQFFVIPGAAIVHQPHAVAQYAWGIDKSITYNCDIVSLVFAKEDSMLFPFEYMALTNGSCSENQVIEYAQGQSSKVSVATYYDRIDFYYGQIQQCRDAFAPYYMKRPLPSAVSEAHPGFSCNSVVECHSLAVEAVRF